METFDTGKITAIITLVRDTPIDSFRIDRKGRLFQSEVRQNYNIFVVLTVKNKPFDINARSILLMALGMCRQSFWNNSKTTFALTITVNEREETKECAVIFAHLFSTIFFICNEIYIFFSDIFPIIGCL